MSCSRSFISFDVGNARALLKFTCTTELHVHRLRTRARVTAVHFDDDLLHSRKIH